MKEGAGLVLAGTIIGLAGAWAIMRVLSSSVRAVAVATEKTAAEPVLLTGVPLLLACLALLACYLPARRAVAIDPAAALRHD
jgi:ABC-type lipoprotein release transport system permease subunit